MRILNNKNYLKVIFTTLQVDRSYNWKIFKTMFFMSLFNYGFCDSYLNIEQIKTAKYLNLTENNQDNYVYIVDYNQKNSFIYNYIKNEIPNLNQDINIRYIPIKSGDKNLCFSHNINNNQIDELNNNVNKKCLIIDSYFYSIESELPILFFSDGSTVKVGSKLDARLTNDFFYTIQKTKLEDNIKSSLNYDLSLKKYELSYYNEIKFLDFYNKFNFYSYFTFGNKKIKEKPNNIYISPVKYLKNSNVIVISNSSPIKKIIMKFDLFIFDYLYNKKNKKSQNYFNYFYNLKIKNNFDEFNILIKTKNINAFCLSTGYIYHKPIEIYDNPVPIISNLKIKEIPKLGYIKYKQKKSSVLSNGNIVYTNPVPPIKKLNIKWGAGGAPQKIKYIPYTEQDSSISIINN